MPVMSLEGLGGRNILQGIERLCRIERLGCTLVLGDFEILRGKDVLQHIGGTFRRDWETGRY